VFSSLFQAASPEVLPPALRNPIVFDWQKKEQQRESAFRACSFHLEKIAVGMAPLPLPENWAALSAFELGLRGRRALIEIGGPRLMASVFTDFQAQLSRLKEAHDPLAANRLLQDLRFLRTQDLDVFSYYLVNALPYFKREDSMRDLFFPLTLSMNRNDPRMPLVAQRLFELGGEEEISDEAGTEILFYRKLMALKDRESLVPTASLLKVFDNLAFIHAQMYEYMTPEKAKAFWKSLGGESYESGSPSEVYAWARLWHLELATEYRKLKKRLSARYSKSKPK